MDRKHRKFVKLFDTDMSPSFRCCRLLFSRSNQEHENYAGSEKDEKVFRNLLSSSLLLSQI